MPIDIGGAGKDVGDRFVQSTLGRLFESSLFAALVVVLIFILIAMYQFPSASINRNSMVRSAAIGLLLTYAVFSLHLYVQKMSNEKKSGIKNIQSIVNEDGGVVIPGRAPVTGAGVGASVGAGVIGGQYTGGYQPGVVSQSLLSPPIITQPYIAQPFITQPVVSQPAVPQQMVGGMQSPYESSLMSRLRI